MNTLVDLTINQFKALIYETVREALQQNIDQDLVSNPRFSPEVASELRAYQQQKTRSIPAQQVIEDLGLDV